MNNNYYNLLENEEKVVYEDIYTAIKKIEKYIKVGKTNDETILKILQYVCMDHPEIFYMSNQIQVIKNPILGNVVKLNYVYTQDEINEIDNVIKNKLKYVYNKTKYMDTNAKIKWVHDYIITTSEYKKGYASPLHNVEAMFVLGKGCCESFSKAFKLMCNCIGLDVIVVTGKMEGELHAWNMVYVEGKELYVDVTNDMAISTPNNIKFEYVTLRGGVKYVRDKIRR